MYKTALLKGLNGVNVNGVSGRPLDKVKCTTLVY